jgi:serine/threonine protein kinase
MGAVYEGYDPALDRHVAIKTLTSAAISDQESRGRFEREAKAAAKLQHQNIVTVYELGNFGGQEQPYIVMEYLEGADVSALIGEDSLPLSEALDIVIQLCRALDFAHQKGVVHRDVKPSNLRYLDNGQIKIMDFGIARLEGSNQITKSGVMIGTLHYMSPEQIRGQKLDGRTDIFSAGCILYELLTGGRPFRGDSATSILYNIVNEEPPPTTEKNDELPQEVQDVVATALSKSPDARFQRAGDMARELEKLLTIFKKSQPRTPPTVQKNLDELEALSRTHEWKALVPKARTLASQYPQLNEAHRHLRTALRALHEQEQKQTANDRTRHLAEIQRELIELYGSEATVRGGFHLDETELWPGKEVTESTTAAPGSESAVRALAAPIWALFFVMVMGLGVVWYWVFIREPEPVPVEHVLRVFSDPPGAAVLLNGRLTGLTTDARGAELRLTGMPNDSHVVELELTGYDSASSDLVLTEQPLGPLQFSLVQSIRVLELATIPNGARVSLNGTELAGTTPLTVELSLLGEHALTLSLSEYRTKTVSIGASDPLPGDPIALTPLKRPGNLVVESSYPVAIHLRGNVLAPVAARPSVSLRPGTYQVQLVASDVFLSRTFEVSIREGETTTLATPALGRVNVRANPGNCSLTVDGISAGSPPIMSRDIVAGAHELVFIWPGDVRDVQTVAVEASKPTYVIGQKP